MEFRFLNIFLIGQSQFLRKIINIRIIAYGEFQNRLYKLDLKTPFRINNLQNNYQLGIGYLSSVILLRSNSYFSSKEGIVASIVAFNLQKINHVLFTNHHKSITIQILHSCDPAVFYTLTNVLIYDVYVLLVTKSLIIQLKYSLANQKLYFTLFFPNKKLLCSSHQCILGTR